jgi:hypothetical protein
MHKESKKRTYRRMLSRPYLHGSTHRLQLERLELPGFYRYFS